MDEEAPILTLQIRIEGRVQGVGFRYWTRMQAERRGLDGWVRNRRDGAVEALFSGDRHAVREMVRLCESGPRGADVSRVEMVQEGGEVSPGFEVKPTA